ncbi:MAG: ATP-grasp domain-containing protein, partial [Candidatus Methylomirabilales bacterium]
LQEYVPGLPCSVAFVADGQRAILLGVSQQLIGDAVFGAGGFRYCGSLLGKGLRGKPNFDRLVGHLEAIVGHLASAFHLVGINGMDFILQGSEVYPLELNPRYTASMELVEVAYGLNTFSVHIAACNGDLPPFDLRRAPEGYWGKGILFAEQSTITPATDDWWDRGIRDIPFPRERIRAGSPICTIFGSGADREACYRDLLKRAEELKREIYT